MDDTTVTGPVEVEESQHEAPPETESTVTPAQMVRAFTVVSGGPAALLAGNLLARASLIGRWPNRLPRGRARNLAWCATACGLAVPWVYGLVVRPRLQNWGSTAEEQAKRYPGDPEDRPLFTSTRAVTIQAPAREVWQWLVQIGQDRGGFYSYDFLENLAGCRLHSAEEVREDLQHLAVGDDLMMMPGVGTHIAEVRPGRSILIENWGAYVIEPVTHESCRLVARSHADRTPGTVAYILFMELPHAIMERKMLLGIKKRAEEHRDFDQTHTGGHDLPSATPELPPDEAPAEFGEPEEAVVDARLM